MARTFEFSPGVRNDAFFRQGRRCGVCGLSFDDQQEFGHHVIPDQSGNAADTADRFLRTVDNCVMLCDSCHYIVHEGGLYAVGAVPSPEYYRYSHPREVDHKQWAAIVRTEYLRVYSRILAVP